MKNTKEGSIERYSRQEDIVPQDKLAKTWATVIGVGSIGRNIALQLAAVGTPKIQLIDHDIVEESNITSQGYLEEDLGKTKVLTTGQACKKINSSADIIILPKRYSKSAIIGKHIFCCVDSMSARKFIFDNTYTKQLCDLFIDCRMSAEILRILTVSSEEEAEHYRSTLFSDSEAFQGSCTAKSTIYCGNLAAALALSNFTKYLRQMPVPRDILFNILATEISIL